ncbi:RNA polymerase factor sigma-54 [Chiayiivirga flava]|uniref:RNA polymerase sigma-54 factor n=1 Tax=Chiayiivirga flava TaxID=659595 RepID=A0A7W8FYA5_9GAMM|nr:RNA polymerase factor sigma-54 [Chiayiivirga flava]MBB5207187.1 RNA polymerase sigma-54 factor [Chiayiivirga flava]
MKPTLQLKLGQSLTLTPQLRQAIRLLQLSSIELETELNEALESNPLLERPEDVIPEPEAPSAQEGPDATPADTKQEAEAEFEAEPEWDLDDYMPGSGSGSGDRDDDGEREVAGAVTEDLQDHLLWQLNLTPMSASDRAIAVALIEAIGDDGYLSETIEAIRDGLRPDVDADIEEIEAVLHRLQRFDPVGACSRNLSECLLVQLSEFDRDLDGLALAKRIVQGHLEVLAKIGPERLAAQLGVGTDEMTEAVALVRSLDPRPGAHIATQSTEYVTPDAYALRHNGVWRVSLAPGCRPQLSINRHYESLIARAGKGDAAYLRGQLQEARWLIKSLSTRADTVLRVAQCIVRHQTGFLEHGPEAMRPLVLREVADELELHESTISRVTTRKYLHTPRGTFEFKHFFSSSLATADGGSASSTAIQAMIKRLVDQEDPRKPLSDAKLANDLKGEGITVARRTVAKYREAMNIPSSNERQRLG